jgi:hypothetical protein
MNRTRIALVVVALVALALPGAARLGTPDPASAATDRSSVVVTYGVGGVLKSDGRLYQWRPESKKWVTLDESFRLDGETRSIHPLPVVASEVARMEGFGFIVTRSGACWLYNLDSNRWENIGRP